MLQGIYILILPEGKLCVTMVCNNETRLGSGTGDIAVVQTRCHCVLPVVTLSWMRLRTCTLVSQSQQS